MLKFCDLILSVNDNKIKKLDKIKIQMNNKNLNNICRYFSWRIGNKTI